MIKKYPNLRDSGPLLADYLSELKLVPVEVVDSLVMHRFMLAEHEPGVYTFTMEYRAKS